MTPMAKIFPREFLELPLRVHSFLRDVPLHDVWVIDLPGGREGITLQEFRSRSRAERTEDIPYATKALLQLRFLLGRIFRLDTPRPGAQGAVSSVPRAESDASFLIAPDSELAKGKYIS
jgi:hypothetical protein